MIRIVFWDVLFGLSLAAANILSFAKHYPIPSPVSFFNIGMFVIVYERVLRPPLLKSRGFLCQ